MNIVEGVVVFLFVMIIGFCIAVFGVARSEIVDAKADEQRALIDGEVYAQMIENQAAAHRAATWAEIETAVKPVAKIAFSLIILCLAAFGIFASLSGSRWAMNKAAAPVVTQVGQGMAIVTHGGQSVVIDLYSGERGNLLLDSGTSPERAITARAVEMVKAEADRPVVLSQLQSANRGEL